MEMNQDMRVGVIGAGAMGAGIAQIAATSGHAVALYDNNPEAPAKALAKLRKILDRLVEKGRMTTEEADAVHQRITPTSELEGLAECGLVIEAIVENLDIKKKVFAGVEAVVSSDAVLASNTSSLSIAAISAACERPERVLGLHFFNPAPLMPLVEVVPGISTDAAITDACYSLMERWKKVPVRTKDTPGFIVNRVARPFYGEALRIYEEGMADFATIDAAMKERGGFRMGPFELMDYIGNDVNYTVTETVFTQFFFDPRYKPSFTQKRMMEAGRLGRKSGRGYYDYAEGATKPEAADDSALKDYILKRILVMLINEAVDALFLNIASKEDLDLAMTKGVNYPKGLLQWADEMGLDVVLNHLEHLQEEYGEDRYRPSPLLKRMVRREETFFS